MSTTNETKTNLSTVDRLEAILAEIEDAPLHEDLFNEFHLRDPLSFAKLLVSLDLPDATKAALLALKVGQPPAHKGEGLEVLIERAAMQMWARLATQAGEAQV
jgi:hypothetical protein